MGLSIEGSGSGPIYGAGVNSENQLLTRAVTESLEHHANQHEKQAFSLPISVSPNAADDCIFYMKNTSDIDLTIEGLTVGTTDPSANDSIYFKLGDTGTRDSATDVTPINVNTGGVNNATGDFETGIHLNDGTLSGGNTFERIVLAAAAATDKVSSAFNFPQDVIIKKNGTFTIWIGGSGTGTYYLTLHFHYHNTD